MICSMSEYSCNPSRLRLPALRQTDKNPTFARQREGVVNAVYLVTLAQS